MKLDVQLRSRIRFLPASAHEIILSLSERIEGWFPVDGVQQHRPQHPVPVIDSISEGILHNHRDINDGIRQYESTTKDSVFAPIETGQHLNHCAWTVHRIPRGAKSSSQNQPLCGCKGGNGWAVLDFDPFARVGGGRRDHELRIILASRHAGPHRSERRASNGKRPSCNCCGPNSPSHVNVTLRIERSRVTDNRWTTGPQRLFLVASALDKLVW
jgi:hypothetical protein